LGEKSNSIFSSGSKELKRDGGGKVLLLLDLCMDRKILESGKQPSEAKLYALSVPTDTHRPTMFPE
jgi:hypothetical protein